VKRYWFTYDDGTFFRNCPLIMRERERAVKMFRFQLGEKLRDEWLETFRRGVQYKEHLGKNEVGIPFPNMPMSEVLPQLRTTVPAEVLAKLDYDVTHHANLPGDPAFRWHYEW
jgi:hypothetical protein